MKSSYCIRIVFSVFLLCLLSACASTTKSGAIGVTRKQLLLVSAESLEQSATANFANLNRKAKASGTLIQGKEASRLKTIAHRIIPHVGVFREDALRWNWQVALIKSPELNAYCMPGGKIVFNTGIIQALRLNNNEIAAIMGHEMAHALREHSRERASESMGSNLLLGFGAQLMGASRETVQLSQKAMHYLITLPHSRQHETEADQMGLELMARAGYDPQAAVNVWRKMMKVSGNSPPQFLSTHPSHSTRIQDLQAMLPVVRPLYTSATRQAGKK